MLSKADLNVVKDLMKLEVEELVESIECIRQEMDDIDLYYSNTGDGIWPYNVKKNYEVLEHTLHVYEVALNRKEER